MLSKNQPLSIHFCQSPLWQEFRRRMGHQVAAAGDLYFSLHPTPLGNIGYCPKPNPEKIDWEKLAATAKEHNCLHLKLDSPHTLDLETWENKLASAKNLRLKKTEPTFAQETVFLDLTKNEEELLQQMEPKTRYNVRLAQKRGVTVRESQDAKGFSTFLTLQKTTAARQHFYLHPDHYYHTLWEVTQPEGVSHLLVAEINRKIISAWWFFHWEGVLYYFYGGSSEEHQNLMPNNLIVWEAIRLGQSLGCRLFDLGGINTDPHHRWAGLTRFKLGFGGQVVKFPGSYDAVFKYIPYKLFRITDKARWFWLNLKRSV